MKKIKKRYYFAGAFLILALLLLFITVRSKKENKVQTLTVCTEESLKLTMQDIVRYFEDNWETPVTFEITYIPDDETQRAGICKKLRTELMAGKGADLYLLSDLQRNGGIAVDEESLLLEDANQILSSGVFLDISRYTEKDENFQKCFVPVMDAGKRDGKQYILPLTFGLPLLKGEAEIPDNGISTKDCQTPLLQLLNNQTLQDVDSYSLLDIKNWIGNSFDYSKKEMGFSKEDLNHVLEAIVASCKTYEESTLPKYAVTSGELENLSSTFSEELSSTEYDYLPMPAIDGRPAATILLYGAVGRSCKNPELAYEVLKLFLRDDMVSRDGVSVQKEDSIIHYLNLCINGNGLSGIPVRADLWEKWYAITSGSDNPTEAAKKNAKSFSEAVNATETARFLSRMDSLGTEIQGLFLENGFYNLEKEGLEEDLQLAADKLYDNIDYIIKE